MLIFGYECDFLFTFVIEEKYSLTSFSGDPTIVLSEEDIFNRQGVIRNQIAFLIIFLSQTIPAFAPVKVMPTLIELDANKTRGNIS